MHPYQNLPSHSYWKSGVASKLWVDLNFKPAVKFKLSVEDKIATGGSCFAQHVAKNLSKLGLNHQIYECAPSVLSLDRAAELQYGFFSARYGNIYTARQLRQVIETAFGVRELVHIAVESETGWIDMLRPGVQTEGFDCFHDLVRDREHHFAHVKKLFLEANCFVFTLGLTEAWQDIASGLVFPSCPGTRAGEFDPAKHQFVNFDVTEVYEDLAWCLNFVREVNPGMKWILTVSPVALAATATENHVLVATSISKSTLRVAADLICKSFSNCEYFPSYEIVSSTPTFGQFLEGDLRNISTRGVELVMRVFKAAFVEPDVASRLLSSGANSMEIRAIGQRLKDFSDAECDESFNDPSLKLS